jgi:hypothetical protein
MFSHWLIKRPYVETRWNSSPKGWARWHTPKLLDGFNCESKGDNSGRRRSWGALCRNPTLKQVWGWLTFPGLPQFQSSIVEVKTPRLEVFFIPLERAQNVDVENGLAWAIQTSAAQVMVKRRAWSQTGSLTPDHKKSGIDPTPGCAEGVQHTIGKLLRRATSLFQTSFQSEVWAESCDLPKFWESKPGQSRDSSLGVPGIKAIWMQVRWSNAENTIWGKVVASPESGPWWIQWVRVARDWSQHQGCFPKVN